MLISNLIIDGLIIYLTLKFNKVKLVKEHVGKLILKAWGFGFFADLIGSLIMAFFTGVYNFDGYHSPKSLIDALPFAVSIITAALLIGSFNYHLSKKLLDERIAKRIGFAMGIITAPWFFLFPEMIY